MSKIFKESLERAGLTQSQFADIINTLSGCKPINRQRTSHWAKETSKPNEAAIALAALLARIPATDLTKLINKV